MDGDKVATDALYARWEENGHKPWPDMSLSDSSRMEHLDILLVKRDAASSPGPLSSNLFDEDDELIPVNLFPEE